MPRESRDMLDRIHSEFEFAEVFFRLLSVLDDFDDVSRENPYTRYRLDGFATQRIGPNAGRRILFELKHASKDRRIPATTVAEAIARFGELKARPEYGDATFVLVTNSYPTLAARHLCEQAGIEVWDRDVLADLFDKAGGVHLPVNSLVH